MRGHELTDKGRRGRTTGGNGAVIRVLHGQSNTLRRSLPVGTTLGRLVHTPSRRVGRELSMFALIALGFLLRREGLVLILRQINTRVGGIMITIRRGTPIGIIAATTASISTLSAIPASTRTTTTIAITITIPRGLITIRRIGVVGLPAGLGLQIKRLGMDLKLAEKLLVGCGWETQAGSGIFQSTDGVGVPAHRFMRKKSATQALFTPMVTIRRRVSIRTKLLKVKNLMSKEGKKGADGLVKAFVKAKRLKLRLSNRTGTGRSSSRGKLFTEGSIGLLSITHISGVFGRILPDDGNTSGFMHTQSQRGVNELLDLPKNCRFITRGGDIIRIKGTVNALRTGNGAELTVPQSKMFLVLKLGVSGGIALNTLLERFQSTRRGSRCSGDHRRCSRPGGGNNRSRRRDRGSRRHGNRSRGRSRRSGGINHSNRVRSRCIGRHRSCGGCWDMHRRQPVGNPAGSELTKPIRGQLGEAVRVKTAVGNRPVSDGNEVLGLGKVKMVAAGEIRIRHLKKLNEAGGS